MMLLGGTVAASAQIQTNAGVQYLQCMQKDMSTDFSDLSNTYFLADSLVSFDAAKGEDSCSGSGTGCHRDKPLTSMATGL